MLTKPEDLIMSFGKAIEEAKLSHPVRCVKWPEDHFLVKQIVPHGSTAAIVSKNTGSVLHTEPYQPTNEDMNTEWVFATVHQRLINITFDKESGHLCLFFHPVDTDETIPDHPFIELYSRFMVDKNIKVGFIGGNAQVNILNAVAYDTMVRMQNEGTVDSLLIQFNIDDEFLNGGWKRALYQDPNLYSFHNPTLNNTLEWLKDFKPEVVIHDGIIGGIKSFETTASEYCKMNGLEYDVDFKFAKDWSIWRS